MRHPREWVPEESTVKGLRVRGAVLGSPLVKGWAEEEGTHQPSASLLLCKPSCRQVGLLEGGGVILLSNSTLRSSKRPSSQNPASFFALAPAQGFPAGSELCNYPYHNYAWQKALAFLGEGFPATSSLFCLALDLRTTWVGGEPRQPVQEAGVPQTEVSTAQFDFLDIYKPHPG